MGNAIVEMFIRVFVFLPRAIMSIGLVMLGVIVACIIAWLGYSEIVLHPNGVAPL
ncbi:hypothetical protein ACFQZO_37145 [Bradyrhizobium sp. GCM10027634]|uniref:hypothetical protein n=1 Tax=unclassified Bradyrhizobium TaxID=2631580 RepID=UPI00263AAD18|nr:hypothetical protein [Bradyrhizobium sp. WYCCWR 12677]MDN5006442.1 hypothetical protein [Bradyrhizobium sp. WYCCWR 12677]